MSPLFGKMKDPVGKIYKTLSQSLTLYADQPEDQSYHLIRSEGPRLPEYRNKLVMVVATNENENIGELFYKVLFPNQEIFWIHNYELIAVDQTTGKPLGIIE